MRKQREGADNLRKTVCLSTLLLLSLQSSVPRLFIPIVVPVTLPIAVAPSSAAGRAFAVAAATPPALVKCAARCRRRRRRIGPEIIAPECASAWTWARASNSTAFGTVAVSAISVTTAAASAVAVGVAAAETALFASRLFALGMRQVHNEPAAAHIHASKRFNRNPRRIRAGHGHEAKASFAAIGIHRQMNAHDRPRARRIN